MNKEEQQLEKHNKILKIQNIIFVLLQIICIIIFAILIHIDINTDFLHLDKLGISKYIPNKIINYVLKVFGAYGLIQVFSQDMGLPIGNFQMKITHHPVLLYLILFSTGYSLTGDKSESLIATLLYFYFKNILSTELINSSTWHKDIKYRTNRGLKQNKF